MDVRDRWLKDPKHAIFSRLPPNIETEEIFSSSGTQNTDDYYFHLFKNMDVGEDPEMKGKFFIKCIFNKTENSYRSPWSNVFTPTEPSDQSGYPSSKLRDLELEANHLFKDYVNQYYGGGIASVFLNDKEYGGKDLSSRDQNGSICYVVIKKDSNTESNKNSWKACHHIDIKESKIDANKKKLILKICSVIMYGININNEDLGEFQIEGLVTKVKEEGYEITKKTDEIVLFFIGRLVEDMENQIRKRLETVSVTKTKDIVFSMRNPLRIDNFKETKKEVLDEFRNLNLGVRVYVPFNPTENAVKATIYE